MTALLDAVDMPFIEARWKGTAVNRPIDLWVNHSMESPEKGTTAEDVARFFQNIPNDPKKWASAHMNFDNNSRVRCVHDKDVAYGAPGVNHNGIHAEHAGYARQSRFEWLDVYSLAMLQLSAQTCAAYCLAYNLPIRFAVAADLAAGGPRMRGITTHWEVTKSKIKPGDHTDPGAGFPMDLYLQYVAGHLPNITTPEVAMARIPNLVGKTQAPNGGIWLCGDDGGVFAFGAPMVGNMIGKPHNAEFCDIVAYSDKGYWLIGQDGGIFAFGDAPAVKPYDPAGPAGLPDEWRRGERAVRFGIYLEEHKTLKLITDDLNAYDHMVP